MEPSNNDIKVDHLPINQAIQFERPARRSQRRRFSRTFRAFPSSLPSSRLLRISSQNGTNLIRRSFKRRLSRKLVQNQNSSESAFSSSEPQESSSNPSIGFIEISGIEYFQDLSRKTLIRVTDENKAQLAHTALSYASSSSSLKLKRRNRIAHPYTNTYASTHVAEKPIKNVSNSTDSISTEICYFYSKYGYCINGDHCKFIHNPQTVTICGAFIKNACQNQYCLLRHPTSQSELPCCHYYLKGNCNDESCPYPHVDAPEDYQICKNFQNAKCEFSAHDCPFVHTFLCAEFKRNMSCSNFSRCRFVHPVKQQQQEAELALRKTIPCLYFSKLGFCLRGDTCHYLHQQQEEKYRDEKYSQEEIENDSDSMNNQEEEHDHHSDDSHHYEYEHQDEYEMELHHESTTEHFVQVISESTTEPFVYIKTEIKQEYPTVIFDNGSENQDTKPFKIDKTRRTKQ